tara:strand:+ start:1080 stop:1352 length:273 start_codon:yes stop_codon:yes gene_type:complete
MAQIKFVHRDEKEVKLFATPIISFNKSKKLSSIDGNDVLYYINVQEAYRLKLESFCDMNTPYPVDSGYCLINIPIIRGDKSKVLSNFNKL